MTVDDPAFSATRANAEPMVRDEPAITLQDFERDDFAGIDVTVAVGSAPNEIIAAAAAQLTELTGRPTVEVEGEHEVYLRDPDVLTSIVMSRRYPS